MALMTEEHQFDTQHGKKFFFSPPRNSTEAHTAAYSVDVFRE
jgi:hypothetical protein